MNYYNYICVYDQTPDYNLNWKNNATHDTWYSIFKLDI